MKYVIGRDFDNGEVEVKLRKEDKVTKVKTDKLVKEIQKIIKKNI